jgi:hypothetical protein
VAIELICEVLKHAPQDLSSAERLVLVVIAEAANGATRKCWPKRETIAHRAGLELSGLKKVFQKLAARGLEVRIPIGKDKKGGLVFAHEGHQTEYLLPRFDIHSPDQRGDGWATTERPEGGQASPSGGTDVPKRGDGKATQSLFEPSGNLSSSARASYRQRIADVANVETDDEIDQIIEQIRKAANGPIRSGLGAYMRSVTDDDIREHADAVRAGSAERAKAARRAEQARQPRCPLHGSNRWNACPCCWADVKAGSDPYAGREDLRPSGWHEVYRWVPPAKTVTVDEVEVEQCPAAVAEVIAETLAPQLRGEDATVTRPRPVTKRPKATKSPCGNPMCRGGVLQVGLTKITCTDCNPEGTAT